MVGDSIPTRLVRGSHTVDILVHLFIYRTVLGSSINSDHHLREPREMVVLWLSAFLLFLILIILVIYQLITLSDLERDYINAYEAVSHINKGVYPELALQLILCFLFLFSGNWVMLLSCIPIVYYTAKLYMQKQHMVNVADIYGVIEKEKTRRLFKLPMLFVPLCLSLFWLIWSVLEDDDHHLSYASDEWSHFLD